MGNGQFDSARFSDHRFCGGFICGDFIPTPAAVKPFCRSGCRGAEGEQQTIVLRPAGALVRASAFISVPPRLKDFRHLALNLSPRSRRRGKFMWVPCFCCGERPQSRLTPAACVRFSAAMTDLEQAAALLEVDAKFLQPFDVNDP